MKKIQLIILLLLLCRLLLGQEVIEIIDEIQLASVPSNQIKKYWLKMIDDGMSQPVCIPIIIAKGNTPGPVLGLTAAIHGNELNGIGVIHQVFEDLDVDSLNGTLIAIPGLNAISLPLHQRRYIDEEDLNRNFPGKANGNRSQQYVWQINQKILGKIDYLIDMHTASFGRVNSLYVRGDLNDEKINQMARIQDADIILINEGLPSTNELIGGARTMRAEAVLKGIPSITIEYGNPQVYQPEMITRGKTGVGNVMRWLKMIPGEIVETNKAIICKKSYWIYVDQGGYLEIPVELSQVLEKGQLIAILRNPFGDIIKKYYCPEKGVVIGKSSNPVNMNGGRIIHLGIMSDP